MKNYCFSALGAILISICSMITIPFVVPFTLQTFACFFVLNLLGGKYGTFSIIIYLLLGIIGLPVFSGFGSGLSAFLGVSGGYLIGFLLAGILFLIITTIAKNTKKIRVLSLILGLIVDYLVGTIWFVNTYANINIDSGFIKIISLCILPFIIPDLVKLVLAFLLSERIKKHI